jgi:hypothetical protein
MVYPASTSIAEKTVRQSVTLSVIVDFIESGIEAREQEKKRFFRSG